VPRNGPHAVSLPAEFQTVSIAGDRGRHFQVVVGATNPPAYDRWIIETRYYSDIARLIVALLRGGGTLVDLGANLGTVCLPVCATGSRVLAVEMLPRNIMKLALAAAVNGLPHCRIVQAAVTDHDGCVGYAGDEAWAQVSTAPTASQAAGMRLDTIIDLIELDSPWFLRPPMVMKIDIEGHELEALHGAGMFLAKYRPAFVFESIDLADKPSGKARAVKEFVINLGYDLHLMRGNILSPHHPNDQQISPVSDILAIPTEGQFPIHAALSDWQMRPLRAHEQLDWLKEIKPNFSAHAATLVPTLKQQIPEVADDLDRLTSES
jgi:FkbM family methyltransferase